MDEHATAEERLARLRELRQMREDIRREIHALMTDDAGERPLNTCLRCGYDWIPHNSIRPSRACPRCGTTAWMKPPTGRSRKPGDPPSPSWSRSANKREKSGRGVKRLPE